MPEFLANDDREDWQYPRISKCISSHLKTRCINNYGGTQTEY